MISPPGKYGPGPNWSLSPAFGSAALFVLIGLLCLWQLRQAPIGDFGNYYYGSKLFAEGRFSLNDYSSIRHFNAQIRSCGETRFFENYTPVPPFSLLAYLPFVALPAAAAKPLFSLAGLLLFAFSWFRFLTRLGQQGWWQLLIPVVLYVPLYSNLYQGQAYLLVAALLLEAYLATERGKSLLAACWLSPAIALKLFPVFLLLYWLLRRQYRTVSYSLLLSALCYVAGGWLAGPGILGYYSFDVLPRLFQNDIVGAYYHGNQSLHTLLLDLFSRDALQNPQVLIQAPWLVPLFEGIFGGLLLALLFAFRKAPQALLFGFTLFVSALFGRYQTSYGLLLLAPFLALLFRRGRQPLGGILCLLLLALAFFVPVGQLGGEALPLRYARLFCLLLAFAFYLWDQRLLPALRPLTACILLMTFLRLAGNPDREIRYFDVQNSQGILYDYEIREDSITLFSTLGEKDVKETFALKGRFRAGSGLGIRGSALYHGDRKLCGGADQKKKPLWYNDSLVLMLSDLNQGVGFYKLRYIAVEP